MMQLYWSPRSRSFAALWLLEETGQPYERVLTDISTGAQRNIEYLAINPMGKVPALKDGEVALAESAAILAYVAERYPEARLTPPIGDPMRARFLYWLFFLPACIEPSIVQISTKLEINPVAAGWGDAQRVFDVLDAALAPGPWILGENFSAADVAIGSRDRASIHSAAASKVTASTAHHCRELPSARPSITALSSACNSAVARTKRACTSATIDATRPITRLRTGGCTGTAAAPA